MSFGSFAVADLIVIRSMAATCAASHRLKLAVLPDPLIQTVLSHTQPGGCFGHPVAPLSDLLHRFNLEFFRVTLVAHDTSVGRLSLRLLGV